MSGPKLRFLRSLLAAAVLHATATGAEPFAYIAETGADNLRVIDLATNGTVANIRVGFVPFGVAIDTAGARVYVTNALDGTVSVIDAAKNQVMETIPVGEWPTGIAVNRAGTRAYVANSGDGMGHTVSVVDTQAGEVVARIRVGLNPLGLAVSPEGSRLYVANLLGGTISVIDTASNTEIATIETPSPPAGLALDAAGGRLYATQASGASGNGAIAVIDTKTHALAGSIAVGSNPLGIALSGDGNRAYVANAGTAAVPGDSVSVIDTARLAVVWTIPVGSGPQGISIDLDDTHVYVTNTGSDSVTVIDTATNTVAARLPSGPGPFSFGHFIGPAPAASYQGLWWRSPGGAESGWGINIAHQGETLFATWFTYDADGSGMWLVMPKGAKSGASSYAGTLYRMTGPAFDAQPWRPDEVKATPAGTGTFTFADAHNGTFTYTVNGTTRSKPITRQVFAVPVPTCLAGAAPGDTPIYQDLWWRSPAGSESGWGVGITHQGETLFATWFTYAKDGKGQWLVMSNGARKANGSYSGTLFRTRGPSFDAEPWDGARVTHTAVGDATFTFTDENHGTFAYTLDGVTQAKAITRQVYASPPTVCR